MTNNLFSRMCTTKKSRRQTLRKLEDLRGVIHTSEVPESLRNRTGEFEAIHRFVLNGVSKACFLLVTFDYCLVEGVQPSDVY